MSSIRLVRFIVLSLVLVATANAVEEPAAPQRVVVIRDGVAIKAGDRPVDVLARGDLFTVLSSRGPWLLVSRGHSGWIDQRDVLAPDAALDQFNRQAAQNPGDAGARAARASLWLEQKAYDQAIAEATEAIRLHPQLVVAYFTRAAAQVGKQNFAAAQQDAQAAIQLMPGSPLGYQCSGDVWSAQRIWDRAIADYSAANDRDRENSQAYLRRAQARLATLQAEQLKLACDDFAAAASLSEHDPPCQHDARIGRCQALVKLGKLDAAIVEYNEQLRRDPSDALALAGRGTIFGIDRQWEKAMHDQNEALLAEPKNPQLYLARALTRKDQFNLKGALKDAAKAIELDSQNPAAHTVQGEILSKSHKYPEAIAAFDKALSLDPRYLPALLGRAAAREGKGDKQLAAADRDQAQRLDPASVLPVSQPKLSPRLAGREREIQRD